MGLTRLKRRGAADLAEHVHGGLERSGLVPFGSALIACQSLFLAPKEEPNGSGRGQKLRAGGRRVGVGEAGQRCWSIGARATAL